MPKKFVAVVFHTQRFNDVLKAFGDAVGYFNSQDWVNLPKVLDDHVVLYTIQDQRAYVGKPEVMKYFKAIKGPQFPNFSPTSNYPIPAVYPMQVTGNANWTDYDADDPHPGQPEPIQYQFLFNPEFPLITYMFATPGS